MQKGLIIHQGIISKYTGPRTCDVIQMPSGYTIPNVRLPNTLMLQTKPSERSVVFVAQVDDYRSYLLSVIRDPQGFLETGDGVRGAREEDEVFFQPGEVFLESRGDPSSPISGSGATLYLANDGTVNIHSGKRKESIVVGGTDDDDDGEIVITADSTFVESNVNSVTQVQTSIRFDEDNLLEIGNYRTVIPAGGVEADITQIAVNELTLDPSGEITLHNQNVVGLEQNALVMTPTGTTTLDANVINFNNGIRGAARLDDTVLSNETNDTSGGLYWQAWVALMEVLLGSPINEPGLGSPSALQAAIQAKLATEGVTALTIPDEVQGKITSSSSSVKVGD